MTQVEEFDTPLSPTALSSGLHVGFLNLCSGFNSRSGLYGAVGIWLRPLACHASEASSILVSSATACRLHTV